MYKPPRHKVPFYSEEEREKQRIADKEINRDEWKTNGVGEGYSKIVGGAKDEKGARHGAS